jgi:hypothetical protein
MVYLVLESSDDIPTVFGSAPDLGGYANAPGRLSYGWSRLVPHRRGARPGPRLLVDLDTG